MPAASGQPTPHRRDFSVSGWIGDFWLAPSAVLRRLVPVVPEVRYRDRSRIRWQLVADAAAEVLRLARAHAEPSGPSPISPASWDISVAVETAVPLTSSEASIVASLFDWEAAVADVRSRSVVNGRHRIYHAWRSGADRLPIQSTRVSDWSHSLLSINSDATIDEQARCSVAVMVFAASSRASFMRRGHDRDFVRYLDAAVGVSDEFLEAVLAEAAAVEGSAERVATSLGLHRR